MASRLEESTPAPVAAVGGGAAMLAAGAAALAVVSGQAGLGLTVLAAPLGAIVAMRFPAATVTGVFLLTGAIGTISAFTPLPPAGAADGAIFCLWLGVLWVYATGKHDRRLIPWVGLLAPGIYIFLTAAQIFTSDPVSGAIESFRISTWYILAFILIAIAPWPDETYRRITRGVVVVSLLVGFYAIFRKITGPASEEYLVSRTAQPSLASNEELRFFGSFLTGHQLSAWCATTIPFLLALGLAWRDRWRLLVALALAVLGFAMFASDVRTGVLAALLGTVAVFALFMLARSFAGRNLGLVLVAVLGVGVLAAGAYSLTAAGSEESADRFARIFSPTEDPAYQARLERWDQAVDLINERTFGYGLGSSGFAARDKQFGPVGNLNLDSSYLKIAIEQGWLLMGIFALALLSLLFALATRAIRTSDEMKASLGIGACGSLVALAMLFYAGTYIEGVTALAAWLLIGIGAAQFSKAPPREPEPEQRPQFHTRPRAASAAISTRSVPSA
jgi:hypothetical protein